MIGIINLRDEKGEEEDEGDSEVGGTVPINHTYPQTSKSNP